MADQGPRPHRVLAKTANHTACGAQVQRPESTLANANADAPTSGCQSLNPTSPPSLSRWGQQFALKTPLNRSLLVGLLAFTSSLAKSLPLLHYLLTLVSSADK